MSITTSEFSDFFTRTLTVWNVTFDDRYGVASYSNPFTLLCWFQKTNSIYTDAKGLEQVAKFNILFDDPLGANISDSDYIVIDRDETATADPTTLTDAYEVGSIGRIAADSIGTRDVFEIMV